MNLLSCLLLISYLINSSSLSSQLDIKIISSEIKPFLPKQYEIIEDLSTREMLSKIEITKVKVPYYISDEDIPGSYVKYSTFNSQFPWSKLLPKSDKEKPIVLLHGFDSSLLEFRKLAPLLSEKNDVYVPDILGWGFNDHSKVKDFKPKAKIDYLKSFIKNVVKDRCTLVGASLGGAISIILAAECPELVESLVLIDAQGFIDGKESDISDGAAKFGVSVLKSQPLRYYANTISYYDKKFANWEVMRIGRLHCFTDSWERASIDFVKSGGFVVSDKVSQVKQKTLVLWGKQDKILDVSTTEKFQKTLLRNEITIIDKCGHVPHIEKPLETAEYILNFLNK